MTFSKILCPIDFSASSEHAMRVAIRLANQAKAELVLAHVWHLPAMAYAGEGSLSANVIQQIADDAARDLEVATGNATKLGATGVSSKLLTGVPWDTIVRAVDEDHGFDLIVMGTHGRTGLSRILLGSVAQSVVRHAACSVLAVHPNDTAKPFAHVLCPIDFSESSRHALDLAAGLADAGGVGITLMHVLELPVPYAGEPPMPEFARDLDKRAAKMLEDRASTLRAKVRIPVVARTRIGSPGAQTLTLLDHDPSFDLVVMGSHGRTGIRRALLGSVAEKVVLHAKCPVLVARKRA